MGAYCVFSVWEHTMTTKIPFSVWEHTPSQGPLQPVLHGALVSITVTSGTLLIPDVAIVREPSICQELY